MELFVERMFDLDPYVMKLLNREDYTSAKNKKKSRLVGTSSFSNLGYFAVNGDLNNVLNDNIGHERENYQKSVPLRKKQPQKQQQKRQQQQQQQQQQHQQQQKQQQDDPLQFEDDGLEYGLLITLEDDDSCQLMFCKDKNFHDIHPNVYCPADFSNVHLLGGGGSGVTIFAGSHPTLGDVVMKHGADKDLKELFALATVAEELKTRGSAAATVVDSKDSDNEDIEGEEKKEDGSDKITERKRNSNCDETNGTFHHRNNIGGLDSSSQTRPFQASRQKSSDDIRERIPEFRFIYISPQHLNADRKTLYSRIKKAGLYKKSKQKHADHSSVAKNCLDGSSTPANNSGAYTQPFCMESSRLHLSADYYKGRICIYDSISHGDNTGSNNSQQGKEGCSLEVQGTSLCFTCHNGCVVKKGHSNKKKSSRQQSSSTSSSSSPMKVQIKGCNGYSVLKSIVEDLCPLMKENRWKFTLGQKAIGDAQPVTGNSYLYQRQLKGPVLDNLLHQYIQLVRHLANLSMPQEKDTTILPRIRSEIQKFERDELPDYQISNEADLFVGKAIKKNIDPIKGRFIRLQQLGKQFREKFGDNNNSNHCTSTIANNNTDELFLTPEERIPAKCIGTLLRPGTLMADVFDNAHMTVIEDNEHQWRVLLRLAVQERTDGSPFALDRIWTCGLTDGGLHNLFLSEDNLWLFDLGEPQSYSPPGFLTKFLFSFFHTLGMQEDESGTTWINRFQVKATNGNDDDSSLNSKLDITAETKELLDHAYDAFEITLDRIIDELFDGDDGLRWLLIRYVTLQLCSDASFCLHKWLIKGGGRPREDNHQQGLEKWLWRALWDFYIAYDMQSSETLYRLRVEHPAHRDDYYDGQAEQSLGSVRSLTTSSMQTTTEHSVKKISLRSLNSVYSSLRSDTEAMQQQQQQTTGSERDQSHSHERELSPERAFRMISEKRINTFSSKNASVRINGSISVLMGDATLYESDDEEKKD